LAVPYLAQKNTVLSVSSVLEGKLLIDATVPLVPPKVGQVQLPGFGSAVAELQQVLGEKVKVVSAFQNVSAHHLKDLEHDVDCDVLVCGDDSTSCDTVIGLCADMGLRGYYAGPICNSAAAETLTSILITINRRYKVPNGAGIRITGIR
jgi:NADPH-dependent F420 reductase